MSIKVTDLLALNIYVNHDVTKPLGRIMLYDTPENKQFIEMIKDHIVEFGSTTVEQDGNKEIQSISLLTSKHIL